MKCETLFILIISVRQHSTQFELTWCNANHLSFVTLKSSSKFNWRQKIRTIFFGFSFLLVWYFALYFTLKIDVIIWMFVFQFISSFLTFSLIRRFRVSSNELKPNQNQEHSQHFISNLFCTLTTNFFFFFLIYFFRSLFLLILFVFCCCRRWNFEPWNHFALYAWR